MLARDLEELKFESATRWCAGFELHAHLISRANLARTPDQR